MKVERRVLEDKDLLEVKARKSLILLLRSIPFLPAVALCLVSPATAAQSAFDIPSLTNRPAAIPATSAPPEATPILTPTAASQTSPSAEPRSATLSVKPSTLATQGTSSSASVPGLSLEGLPRGFRGIELGMNMDEVSSLLSGDPLFRFRGLEDVSLLPSPNQSLIEASGLSFVKRAFFQFVGGKLWVMIFSLNPSKIDYYTIYSSLVGKYGEAPHLNPKETRWEDGATRIALERPLTLRYLDLAVLDELKAGSSAKESIGELELGDFLDGL